VNGPRFTNVLFAVVAAIVLVLAAILVLGPGNLARDLGLNPGHPDGYPGPCSNATANATSAGSTLVTYLSSVDGSCLSYYEWLPSGFDQGATYPFALFLHGLGHGGDEIGLNSAGPGLIAAASADGFILASLNTRTGDGFYVNSPFSGPQQQDVVDAVAHEEQLRHIGKLYLFGSSMGSIGSFTIALNHVLPVAGVGLLNTCTDLFEGLAWRENVGLGGSIQSFESTTGGQLPGQSNQATAETYYLSSARFYPSNWSGIPVYIVQGGNDMRCPNNPNFMDYQQANATVLSSTCTTEPQFGEPANCTVPLLNLSTRDPSAYNWRFVYVPLGIHDLSIVNGADLFGYFSGKVGDGLYWASQGGTPVPHSLP